MSSFPRGPSRRHIVPGKVFRPRPLHDALVDVAPTPAKAIQEEGRNGMVRLFVVGFGVLVAGDPSAGLAEPQIDPACALLLACWAAIAEWLDGERDGGNVSATAAVAVDVVD